MRYSYTDKETANLNFRVSSGHAALVVRAAKLHNETLASFMRRVILEWAAAEVGEEAPDLSIYAGDVIARAASKLNISAAEFTKRAARESALRTLQLDSGAATSLEATSAALGAEVGLPVSRRTMPASAMPPKASESGEHQVVRRRRAG